MNFVLFKTYNKTLKISFSKKVEERLTYQTNQTKKKDMKDIAGYGTMSHYNSLAAGMPNAEPSVGGRSRRFCLSFSLLPCVPCVGMDDWMDILVFLVCSTLFRQAESRLRFLGRGGSPLSRERRDKTSIHHAPWTACVPPIVGSRNDMIMGCGGKSKELYRLQRRARLIRHRALSLSLSISPSHFSYITRY